MSVWFGSGELRFRWTRFNHFLVQYTCHTKISSAVENFGSGIGWFGSIRVSCLVSGEPFLDVGLGMDPGSVQISDQFCQF